ncbi:MAG: hypothetical protein CVU65_06215 [Deltaproteobacteria bacterium HGW-Deltaproteobacteria-22]|nr:MAG: hypothetical protein CVU65_06215 [Deltaproteobacteria bacterium HGW-Deltaproteobacteria-22]
MLRTMNKWLTEPQVLGQYMLRVFNSVENPERFFPLRQKLGLMEVEAGRWYPQTTLLKFFGSVLKTDGEDILFHMGLQLIAGTAFPPNVVTFQEAISSMDLGYTIAHRYQVGAMFGLRASGEMQLDIIAANPYPCPYDWGILQGIMKNWAPAARLSHDFSQGCRLDGETACHYHLIF